jgi:hypothetical protein
MFAAGAAAGVFVAATAAAVGAAVGAVVAAAEQAERAMLKTITTLANVNKKWRFTFLLLRDMTMLPKLLLFRGLG